LRTRTRLPAPEAQLMAGRSLAMTPMLTFYELITFSFLKFFHLSITSHEVSTRSKEHQGLQLRA